MRLGLIQGIITLCRGDGYENWCALMEPSLLRLLHTTSIHFTTVGPLGEHRGLRQSCHARIATLLERLRREREPLWRYLTANVPVVLETA